MGYEKFVKKVFPFIGNQYLQELGSDISSYKTIRFNLNALSNVALYYCDFENGQMAQLDIMGDVSGKVITYGRVKYIDENEHYHWELGIVYLDPNAEEDPITHFLPFSFAKGESISKLTPWSSKDYGALAVYLLEIQDSTYIKDSEIKASDLGISEAFVVWAVDPNDLDWTEVYKDKTPEEREATELCTVYYK